MINAGDKIRVLVFQEGNGWIAQALEFDLCAQGRDMFDAMRAFDTHVRGQIDLDRELGLEPLSGIAPAPERFFNRWARAVKLQETLREAVRKALAERNVAAHAPDAGDLFDAEVGIVRAAA